MRYLLVWVAVSFSLGIVFASLVQIPSIVFFVLGPAMLAGCAVLFSKRLIFVLLALCTFFLLGALHLSIRQGLPENDISHFIWQPKGSLCMVQGLIDTQPALQYAETVFELAVQELRGENYKVNCRGRILVKVKGAKKLVFGQRVILRGSLSRIYKGYGPQGARYQQYLARRGIFAKMHVPFVAMAKVVAQPHFSLKGLALSLKDAISSRVACYLQPVPAGVVNAMITGEKKGIPPLVYQGMMKTGTVHILVVSGFNTNLVIGVVCMLLKLWRIPRKIRFFLALPVLFLYCLATGATPPVARATVMTVICMAVWYFKREADIFNACAGALLVILLVDPWQLLGVSLQLSFMCVLSIAYLYPKLEALFHAKAVKNKVLACMADGFLVSLSAWIGTMGILAWYFRSFSPVTVLANIVIVPLATLITLSGVSLVLASLCFPAAAQLIGHACQLFVALLLNSNYLMLTIPWASFQF